MRSSIYAIAAVALSGCALNQSPDEVQKIPAYRTETVDSNSEKLRDCFLIRSSAAHRALSFHVGGDNSKITISAQIAVAEDNPDSYTLWVMDIVPSGISKSVVSVHAKKDVWGHEIAVDDVWATTLACASSQTQ